MIAGRFEGNLRLQVPGKVFGESGQSVVVASLPTNPSRDVTLKIPTSTDALVSIITSCDHVIKCMHSTQRMILQGASPAPDLCLVVFKVGVNLKEVVNPRNLHSHPITVCHPPITFTGISEGEGHTNTSRYYSEPGGMVMFSSSGNGGGGVLFCLFYLKFVVFYLFFFFFFLLIMLLF